MNFNCIYCFLKTGEYPDFNCGECGRWAAGDAMTEEEINNYIISAYNKIIEYNKNNNS